MLIAIIIFLVIGIIAGSAYYYFSDSGTGDAGSSSTTSSTITATGTKSYCPTGTAVTNAGGLSNVTGCKCPIGQKYINSKCIANSCPVGMSYTGLGGPVTGYPGCNCPEYGTVYSSGKCNPCPVDKPYSPYSGICVSCSGGSSVDNKGVVAGSSGCFCPIGMEYINSQCTTCVPIVKRSFLKAPLSDWLSNSQITFINEPWGQVIGLTHGMYNNPQPAGWISQKIENFIIGKNYVLIIQAGSFQGMAAPAMKVQITRADGTDLISIPYSIADLINPIELGGRIFTIIFNAKERYYTIKISQTRNDGLQMNFLALNLVTVMPINVLTTATCSYPIFANASFYTPSISQDISLVTTLAGWTITGKMELMRNNIVPCPSGLQQTLCLYGKGMITQTIKYLTPNSLYVVTALVRKHPSKPIAMFYMVPELDSRVVDYGDWFTIAAGFTPTTPSVDISFYNGSGEDSAVMIALVTIAPLT